MSCFSRSACPRLVRGLLLMVGALAAGLGATGFAQAAPYRPADPAEVLERLPVSAAPRSLQGRRLSADQAAELARVFIERGRSSGDPRELGYAQGVLAPWWSAADAPDRVLLLRATLRQARHDFDGALADLARLLARRPEDAQAWLTQATVLRVLGRYDEARRSCAELQGRTEPFIAALCAAAVQGLHGEATQASAALEALAPALSGQSPGVAAWYYAERAELAERLGQRVVAERWYRQALIRVPDDHGLRAAYADLLLDDRRAPEVLALIDADVTAEALMLRRALALQALGDPQFAALDLRIRDNFDAARRRGEPLHLREEARYALARGETALALTLARQNWAVQHEPWDARLLLVAAMAAGQPQAASTVRDWLRATGLQDARLTHAGGAP
ncbi:MAG TPA: hypothetical protein VGE57_03745 [Solimonas sp.]